MPPKVAAYWSCLPPLMFKSLRSISYAKCAISYLPKGNLNHSTKAPIKETTMVDDVPKPDPWGASM